MPLSCYWCGHEDVALGRPCPGCGVQLEVLVGRGRDILKDLEVVAYKEMILAEDARVLRVLQEIASG